MHKWGKGESDSLLQGLAVPGDPGGGSGNPIKSQGARTPFKKVHTKNSLLPSARYVDMK
jgi:hypothetical protein